VVGQPAQRVDGYAATRHHHLTLIRRLAGDTIAARLATDPALPRLSATLSRATHAGYHPDQLLAAVTTRRELATAYSVALVLAWRIEHRDRYQITGPDPIGLEPSPTDPQRWHAWHHARTALRTATLAGHAAHASNTWLLAAVARNTPAKPPPRPTSPTSCAPRTLRLPASSTAPRKSRWTWQPPRSTPNP
jgi:hypothetical protein